MGTTKTNEMYTIYKAPGWHGEPDAPVVETTDDERRAAMLAGLRMDHEMPGGCNRYSQYAENADGEKVERVDSYHCFECEKLIEWGESGPTGTMSGAILECPEIMEKHLVEWVCDDCAEGLV